MWKGVWLANYKSLGVKKIQGIDGDYIEKHRLKINLNEFEVKDLSKPFKSTDKFDIAQSLEVAEHLQKKMQNYLFLV